MTLKRLLRKRIRINFQIVCRALLGRSPVGGYSVDRLLEVEEERSLVTASVNIVGDVLYNITKLVAAAMVLLEAKLKIREKNICFGKLLQNAEYEFSIDITGRWKKDNLPIAGLKLWRLSSFRNLNNCSKFLRKRKAL